ncbi:MAG: hypothetical protein FWH12_09940 [Treponema sp.]|nr:hypothetical protein [Treponema sp.]
MSKRFLNYAACLFIMAIFLAGCGGGAGDSTTQDDNDDFGGVISQPPSSSSGAPGGVWVDSSGNLRIQATLYDGAGNPITTGNVQGSIWVGPGTPDVMLGTAAEVNPQGAFNLTIPIPASQYRFALNTEMVDEFGNPFPNVTITNGHVAVTSIDVTYSTNGSSSTIKLSPWPLSTTDKVEYSYYYATGSASVVGTAEEKGDVFTVDMQLVSGWNSFWAVIDSNNNYFLISQQPPSNVRWVYSTNP